ncbi:hypothetical protein UC8_13620 [Roseimaritima ulvae]|uniref:Uncharacterized protein n=1 Tax=Roseimaritima ulvae TaxID=980254 RepID=A0A5B9QPF0_9BACT|nr:hypothetical protein UC8_13620 [Roseimaritima ulvae]
MSEFIALVTLVITGVGVYLQFCSYKDYPNRKQRPESAGNDDDS